MLDNKELLEKLEEILKIENFFDMIEALLDFDKEYKTSSFYKKTKMALMDVVKYKKQFKGFDLKDFFEQLQVQLNGLDLSNVSEVLDQIGTVFGQENDEIVKNIQEIKSLRNE